MLREEIKNIKSTRRDLRNFGLTVGIALGIFGGVFLWLGKTFHPYLLIPGVFLVGCGLVAPWILKPLQRAWMTLAVVLGWVMTRVILGVLFFLMITPMGLAARLFGKEFLSLKYKRDQMSYWNVRREKADDRRSSEMQF